MRPHLAIVSVSTMLYMIIWSFGKPMTAAAGWFKHYNEENGFLIRGFANNLVQIMVCWKGKNIGICSSSNSCLDNAVLVHSPWTFRDQKLLREMVLSSDCSRKWKLLRLEYKPKDLVDEESDYLSDGCQSLQQNWKGSACEGIIRNKVMPSITRSLSRVTELCLMITIDENQMLRFCLFLKAMMNGHGIIVIVIETTTEAPWASAFSLQRREEKKTCCLVSHRDIFQFTDFEK